jgi:putative hydrolase of the HAD superfamily
MLDVIKGAAFDLDGTLYPNYRFNLRLIPFIIKEWRLLMSFGKARKIIRKEQEDARAGHNAGKPALTDAAAGTLSQDDFYKHQAEITAELLSVNAGALQEKIDRLIYKGWEPLFKTIKLYKNAVLTLNALKKAGYKLGILSDFPLENKLEYLGISGIWDAVVSSENCGVLKPHPLPFAELAKAMFLPPEEIIYVGNSYSYDVDGAHSAGMKTAWITSGFIAGNRYKNPEPDFTFNNYRQFYSFMLN